MSAMVWAAEGGYAEIVSFRKNPSLYLNSRRIDEETFAHNILQALCQESVPMSVKIHLVNNLQEYAAVILPSITSAEEVVASLLDIFHQTLKSGPSIFRGQILVTSTSIALQFDFHEERVELFAKLVETLLEVVCQTGAPATGHFRAVVCACLQELETSLPCMLQSKMEYVYQLAQMEKGAAAQGYFLLLVTILRHALGLLRLQQQEKPAANALGALLTDRTEPLKPYILPKATSDCTLLHKADAAPPLEGVDLTEGRRLVGFVVDHAPLLTPTGQVHVLLSLIRAMGGVPDMSPSMFKFVIMRTIRTCDLGIIGLLLTMQETYGMSLVDATDQSVMWHTILTAAGHPALSLTMRLLLMDSITQLTQVDPSPGWPSWVSPGALTQVFPRAFDGCELQLKKLEVLSRLLPRYLPEDEVEEVLCSCLQITQRGVESGLGARHATVLFRALYAIYRYLPDPELTESIKWILVRLAQNHSRLTLRVLNFVEAAQKLYPDSPLGREVLLSLLAAITACPPSSSSPVQHHLVVLRRIAADPNIHPKVIVKYMQELVAMDSVCCHGDWETGSLVLSVCRSLMAHPNMADVFVGLGHVLHTLSTTHCDIDIQDRAAFYYTLIATLAPHKLRSLVTQTSGQDTRGLAVLVSQRGQLAVAPAVHVPDHPPLRLTRVQNKRSQQKDQPAPEIKFNSTDSLEKYLDFVEKEESLKEVVVDMELHFDKESTDGLDEIFALELHFESSPFYEHFSDVKIPYMTRSGDTPHRLQLTLRPAATVPVSLSPEAVFTGRDGITWRTLVDGVDVTLEDLWRPLPVTADTRGTLVKALWAALSDKADSADCEDGPLQTILSLNLDGPALNTLLTTRWDHLVVDVGTTLSVINANYSPQVMTSEARTSGALTPEKVKSNAPTSPAAATSGAVTSCRMSCRHLAMFLPPSHHLVVEVVPSGGKTVTHVVTDHPDVLPLLTEYLRGFEEHT